MTNFYELDEFTRAYVACAVWCACGPDSEELSGKDQDDFAPETLDKMAKDCAEFQAQFKTLLADAYKQSPRGIQYDAEQAGHDFWLTRNGHGAGFWDRGLGRAGERLTEACGWKTTFPEISLYLGDDGLIY